MTRTFQVEADLMNGPIDSTASHHRTLRAARPMRRRALDVIGRSADLARGVRESRLGRSHHRRKLQGGTILQLVSKDDKARTVAGPVGRDARRAAGAHGSGAGQHGRSKAFETTLFDIHRSQFALAQDLAP
jgi:hypothetical protein